MSDLEDQEPEQDDAEEGNEEDEATEPETIIDILTGQAVSASTKNKLVQSVLRQLIETYGFDRSDLRAGYRLTTAGKRQKTIDIVILRHGTEAMDENVERIVVCVIQKKREKLRTLQEADADLQGLREKMQLLPDCSFGWWTNSQEDFILKAAEAEFEVRFLPLGAWPAPGESTEEILQEGGSTQVPADPEDLGAALSRCLQYLTKNLRLNNKQAFEQIAVFLIAKLFDETRPVMERQFWIRGNEPFVEEGQRAIRDRVQGCIDAAKPIWPDLFRRGWDLRLDDASQVARIAMELARYSMSETLPHSRTVAYRGIARVTMDGQDGRYPTPLNVAEMAVRIMNPRPGERILDCASGTGTFLAMAAVQLFSHLLSETYGTTPEEATPEVLLLAQQQVRAMVEGHFFGCEMDPDLAVASRLNVLFTVGHPAQVFRLDSLAYPDGDLDGLLAAREVVPDGSIDLVLTNPWFSTNARGVVTEEPTLRRLDLGKIWNPTEERTFVNSGTLNTAGVPPEVLFLDRAWRWAKPGTGRVAILLPNGLLGNPSDEYIRWWILRHCEVLASIDLPIEPFKVTAKDYKLTPAQPSLLVLRRRSDDELKRPLHPDYVVFMAIVDKAGVDRRGNLLYQRAADGDEIILETEVIERVRDGGRVEARRVMRRQRPIADQLPTVSEEFRKFELSGRSEA
jgi:type I restriction enzyme M protein